MREIGTQAYRALYDRGPRRFLADATAKVVEQLLVPRVDHWFANRLLDKQSLFTICAAENTFFDHYDRAESYALNLPTTSEGYHGTERERMLETYASGVRIDAPYVCELTDVDLVGPDAVSIKDQGYVFENSLESTGRLTTSCLRAVVEGTPPVQSSWLRSGHEFDTVVSLVGPWAGNYTHWFQDYLTRLEGLEYYRSEAGVNPAVLIPGEASGWMRDALRAIGYGPDRWIEWDGGRAHVGRLIVSSVRREARERAPNRRIVYSPTGVRWVRNRIRSNIDVERTVPHSERIYLSRSNALTRRVRNEDEVMTLLSDWGFELYRPEELSFAEQVTLFSDAEAIVSPHGSGLMNQIFADDAVVVELMGKKQTVTTPATEYFYAELLGHDYACVPGEAVGADLRTDVSGLEVVLKKLLGKP